MAYIHHVTLTTGHRRRSPRDEVSDTSLASLHDPLSAALGGGRPAIPGVPAYTLSAAAEGKCLIATVWRDDAPLVTLGVAGRSRCGGPLWRMLHDHSVLPTQTRRDEAPPAPWCAARLEPGIVGDSEAATWLGDFERTLAWAWLSRAEAS
jgi:hypothetical protein